MRRLLATQETPVAAVGPGPRHAWFQMPGGPHMVFNGVWLARDHVPALLPGNHSRAAGRMGVLGEIPHKLGHRCTHYLWASQPLREAAKQRG